MAKKTNTWLRWSFKNNKRNGYLFLIIFALSLLTTVSGTAAFTVKAQDEQDIIKTYDNQETGYQAVLQDEAQLMTSDDRERLIYDMRPITQYGNAAFLSVNENNSSTSYLAEYAYNALFGQEPGTIFVIDMYNRQIYVYSYGSMLDVISVAYANTITDNVYKLATNGDYYGCASKAYEQIISLLQGQKISQPMKYVSNALLAIVIALLLNYILVRLTARVSKPTDGQLIEGVFSQKKIGDISPIFVREDRVYSPRSSGGSGGGGGGGGHSGGGGGGHSF